MLDLESQLHRYADEVERRYPDISVEEIVGDLRHTARLRRLPMITQGPATRRNLGIVLAAALVVLVLFGGVALFTRMIGTGPAPVVTEPEGAPTTTAVETSPEQDADGPQVLETSLGTWVWTYVGEGWEVERTLLAGLYDPPVPAPELGEVPLPQIDGMEWWPRLYDAASVRSGEITVTIVPVEGHVDWSAFYAHDAGWVEGKYGPFRFVSASGQEGWTVLAPGGLIELPATLRIVAMQAFSIDENTGEHREVGVLTTLEVSVVSGDSETVEFRDQETGNLVLRLAATDPELTAEQLVRAGHSCGLFGCPVSLWRLFVDGAEAAWIDPPWLGLAVGQLAIAAGSEGFVIVAVAESSTSPPTLHSWASADGMVWEEFRPPQAIDIPAGSRDIRLQLLGGRDLLVAVMGAPDLGVASSVLWTSTDRSEWQQAQMDNPGFEADHVGLTANGWIMVGFRHVGIGPRCEVWVSVDAVTWEQVALPSGRADGSQCHLVGNNVVLGTEKILDWGAYQRGEEFESLYSWWRGEFEE